MSDDSDRTASDTARRTEPIMPFHASFLALSTPLLAAVLGLFFLGASPIGIPLIASVLAPAFGIGGMPAFLAGRLDAALLRKGWSVSVRLVTVGGLGFLAGLVVLAPFYLGGMVGGPVPLLLPLACSIAAIATLAFAILMARIVVRSGGERMGRKS